MTCPFCGTASSGTVESCEECGKVLSDRPPGTVLADRYRILELVGRGSMGSVHKAHDQVLDETVAIKVLRPHFARTPEIAQRFRSEIKLARRVRHPNVCAIHEYGEADEVRYISMEFVDGVDLRQRIRQGGGLPGEEAFGLAQQILAGLQAVHDTGIIHRDLKTPNIMLDAEGQVRLMDFGMARQRGSAEALGGTAVGQILGTPEFMSPEQVRGERADFQSDIYAMGIILYELFTGEVPFKGTLVETMMRHVNEEVPLEGPQASRIPPALVPVLRKTLAKAPQDRYASARGLAAALRHAAIARQPDAPEPRDDAGPELLVADASFTSLEQAAAEALRAVEGWPVPASDASRGPAARESVQSLIAALKDGSPALRRQAAETLGECGPAGREAIGPLIAALEDPDFWVGEAAADALRKITGAPEPPRERRNRPEQEAGVPPAVQSLLRAMQDPRSRWMAVVALGELGAAARDAVPALIEALEDTDAAVRWDSAKALGKLGPAAARAVPALAAIVHERGDAIVRQYAVAALGAIGAPARAAVPALIGALKEESSNLDEQAGDALVRIGAPAVPALVEAMKDEDPQVRVKAATTLTRIAGTRPASPGEPAPLAR
jgi:HEAT repeat protein/tRNA A-37 threonylcarbamoyl transferase component Bud32